VEGEFEAMCGLLRDPGSGLFGDEFDRRVGRIGGIEELEEFDEFAAAMTVPDQGVNLAADGVDAGQQARRAVAFIFKLACEGGVHAGLGRQIRSSGCDRLYARLLVVGDDRHRFAWCFSPRRPPPSGFSLDPDVGDRRAQPSGLRLRRARRSAGLSDGEAPAPDQSQKTKDPLDRRAIFASARPGLPVRSAIAHRWIGDESDIDADRAIDQIQARSSCQRRANLGERRGRAEPGNSVGHKGRTCDVHQPDKGPEIPLHLTTPTADPHLTAECRSA
jgi:hypothetical protein